MSAVPATDTIRAAEWRAKEDVALAIRPRPVAGPGQATVAVALAGICGSDLHSYRHGFAVRPGQVLGHEFSGRVLDASDVPGLAAGDRVTVRPLTPCTRCEPCRRGEPQLCEDGLTRSIGYGVDGAFADEVLVPRAVVGETVFPLPDAVSDRAGALVEPLAVAFRAVALTGARPGGVAYVAGAGPIGLGAVAALRIAGVDEIVVADPSSFRRARAARLGATRVVDPLEEQVLRVLQGITGRGARGRGARVAFALDCAGAPGTLATCVDAAGPGGVVVIAAVGSPKVELAPDRIVEREVVVRGSFGYRDEFAIVIDALERGLVDVEAMISHEFALQDVGAAFAAQADAASSAKVLLAP